MRSFSDTKKKQKKKQIGMKDDRSCPLYQITIHFACFVFLSYFLSLFHAGLYLY